MWVGVHGRSEPSPSAMVLTPCPLSPGLSAPGPEELGAAESPVSRAGGGAHLEKVGEGARGGEEASKRRHTHQVGLSSWAVATLFSPVLRIQL